MHKSILILERNLAMNNKKPLIMRIIVLAIAAAMVLGLVISTAMGTF